MLKEIISRNHKSPRLWKKLTVYFLIILLGIILGAASEWLEYNTFAIKNDILRGCQRVFNNFSVWIFIATLIAYFSWSPIWAGVHTFSFFAAMCVAYFIPKHIHYGYSVDLQLLVWMVIAFISIVAAVLIWFSHIGGTLGNITKALPVAAILTEFVYTVYFLIDYSQPIPGRPAEPFKYLLQTECLIQLSVNLLFMIILILALVKRKQMRLQVSLIAIGLGSVLSATLITMLNIC